MWMVEQTKTPSRQIWYGCVDRVLYSLHGVSKSKMTAESATHTFMGLSLTVRRSVVCRQSKYVLRADGNFLS